VTILCKLYALWHIKHPRLPLVVDLGGWAHPALYGSLEVDLGEQR